MVFGTIDEGSNPSGGTTKYVKILKTRKIMNYTLTSIQIIISVLLITVIMLQPKNGGFGSGPASDQNTHTRRGFEKVLFKLTFILAVFFIFTSLANIFLA